MDRKKNRVHPTVSSGSFSERRLLIVTCVSRDMCSQNPIKRASQSVQTILFLCVASRAEMNDRFNSVGDLWPPLETRPFLLRQRPSGGSRYMAAGRADALGR